MNTSLSQQAMIRFLITSVVVASAYSQTTAFINGSVVTMDARATTAQAVTVRAGRILAVGTNEQMRALAGDGAKIIDLGGKTLLPGFYAAHDHFPNAGIIALYQVDLNSPPIGTIRTMANIVAALRAKAAKTPGGTWIVGRGYDDTLIEEKRHPHRTDLDLASQDHPIVLIHTSGHLSAANSRALQIAGVTRDTPQPKGGRIIKDERTGEPTGVIEESQIVQRQAPAPTRAERLEAIRWADRHYLSRGVTTVVIAGGGGSTPHELQEAVNSGIMHVRVVAMRGQAALQTEKKLPALTHPSIRTGGVKLWQDGSIQGFTGYLSSPYFRPPAGQPDLRGYPARSRQELIDSVVSLHRAGHQIGIHGNGDAAIDDILDAYEEAQRRYPRRDARHRIEHCQTVREDQLDRMKAIGITPSFFVGHVYYWGDRHRDIFLGPERAARISPLASAIRRGIRFTVHDDTPVTPVNPLQLVWAAATRTTKAGKTLGPDQRISVLHALRAVTSDAAWQNFEETRQGSIEPGKNADFVVLDRNPLEVPVSEIRHIRVLETIIAGRSLYLLQ